MPDTLTQLQPGTYDNATRSGLFDPAKAGLNWSGEGRGCSAMTGWFVIDSVTYTNNDLSAIDLHFEQHCEDRTPALRGRIHWSASDSTTPPGPIHPAPAGLWQPAPGATPASGNYIYFESDPGDWVGTSAASFQSP
jgi:hypothetical protein